MHQTEQQKIVDELRTIFVNDKNRDLTRDDVEKLTYLDWCIKETMRLFPMVAIISRQNDKWININGTNIAPGTSLGINIYRVHREKKYWGENVESFNPNRFSPENVTKHHSYSYLAFSAGPRSCIGGKNFFQHINFQLILNKFFSRQQICIGAC